MLENLLHRIQYWSERLDHHTVVSSGHPELDDMIQSVLAKSSPATRTITYNGTIFTVNAWSNHHDLTVEQRVWILQHESNNAKIRLNPAWLYHDEIPPLVEQAIFSQLVQEGWQLLGKDPTYHIPVYIWHKHEEYP